MGYSIRNSHWRAIFWRERSGPKILATELYDEQNDPNETISLADRSEHSALMESFAKHLPPVGSAAIEANASKGKKAKAGAAKTTEQKPTPAIEFEDRATRFDRFDKAKAGRLNRDEYLATQSNELAAKERFEKWDTNKDGFLTRKEFISMGKE